MVTTVREAEAVLAETDRFSNHSEGRLRPAYGFDDVAIVPGVETIDPDDVDLSWQLGGLGFTIPFVASAMDGVVDVPFAIALGRLGGLAVLNLEGLQTRYERPGRAAGRDRRRAARSVTALLQRLYRAPLRDDLVARRVAEIKAGGVLAAVSPRPAWPSGSAGSPPRRAWTSSWCSPR